jgi:hypothetical protein
MVMIAVVLTTIVKVVVMAAIIKILIVLTDFEDDIRGYGCDRILLTMNVMMVVLMLIVNDSSCDGGDVGPGDDGSGECGDLDYGSCCAGGDECRNNFVGDGCCDDYYDGVDDNDGTITEEVLGLLHVHRVLRL